MNEACIVFTGEEPEGAGGKLEKLQRALSSENNQHLIVLDGLERVQSEGKVSGHAKGDLEDHRLKNLLRAIAEGLGNARALITSRFKLTDLIQWEGAGYKSHELDILDKEAAIQVLRAWKIKGNDNQLTQITESVGRHALSVSVLGSYLNNYCDCNPDAVSEFNLTEISPEEPLAARLSRILGGYAKNLTEQERDLLVRLSIFPKGVSVDILGYLIDAGGEIAGTLIGVNQKKLLTIAEKLKQQGLIYSNKIESTIVYSSHPFLRDYFRTLLGVSPEDIHEVVRNKLSIGLDTKPEKKPSDTVTLDKYEKLIEHSILAGHYQEAFDLFYYGMTGSGRNHLLHVLGDYGRIIRILSLFSEDGTIWTLDDRLSKNMKNYAINVWGLASQSLGDLKTSHACFSQLVNKEKRDINDTAQNFQNLGFLEIQKGLLPSAKKSLQSSIDLLIGQDIAPVKDTQYYNYAFIAQAFHLSGEISLAKEYLLSASEINGGPLFSLGGFSEIFHLIDTGDKKKALKRTRENLAYCEKLNSVRDISLSNFFLGMLCLPHEISKARDHFQSKRYRGAAFLDTSDYAAG